MLMLPKQVYMDTLVKLLLQIYFSRECSYIISDDTFMDINLNNTRLILNFHNSNLDLRKPLHKFGCQYFIVYSNHPRKILEYIEDTIRLTQRTKFRRRRYLFIPLTLTSNYLDNIFESETLEYIAEILLIKPMFNEESIELVTNKFVGAHDHKAEILLDKWFYGNKTFLFGVNLYPDKIRDQMGRALRICTFDYKPYVNAESEIGMELMMAKEYAKLHNMSIKLILESEYWGVINDANNASNGAKETMLADKADISMGSWYPIPNYTKYFDLTEQSVRFGVTFLVPAPKPTVGWFTPLLSFSLELWIGFILTYFLIIAFFFGFNYTYKLLLTNQAPNPSSIFTSSVKITTITLFLQQPMPIFLLPKFMHLRLNLTIILILSLIYSAAYTAGFASILTIPTYERGIRNSEDFEKSGLKWGAIHPALLDGFKDLEKYQNIAKNILILNDEEIRERMKSHSFAMLADRVPNGIVIGNRVDANDVKYYRVLDDDVFTNICVMLTRKSSILIPSIKKQFLAMKEGGLPYIWELKASFEENYKAQIALKLKTENKEFVNLEWRDVQGNFAILAIGLLAAMISFLFEIIHFQSTKHSTKFKLFRICTSK